MLQLMLKDVEFYDESSNRFYYFKGGPLKLEHSLMSLAKWESKWEIRFIPNQNSLSQEQFLDYIKCMTIGQVKDDLYYCITQSDCNQIYKYINSKQSACTITKEQKPKQTSEEVSAETIYWWMTMYGIPFECEKWHLNRLLTLIDFIGAKNSNSSPTTKKSSPQEVMKRNAALNARNRARFHSKG